MSTLDMFWYKLPQKWGRVRVVKTFLCGKFCQNALSNWSNRYIRVYACLCVSIRVYAVNFAKMHFQIGQIGIYVSATKNNRLVEGQILYVLPLFASMVKIMVVGNLLTEEKS